jgi:hypothetical protein
VEKSQKPEKKRNEAALLGLLLLFAAGGVLFFEAFSKKPIEGQMEFTSLQSKETQKKVNRHLQETSRQIYLREQKAYIESQKSMKQLEKAKAQSPYKADQTDLPMPHYEEPTRRFSMPSDPNELIQEELFREQAERRYTEAYKKEYTRQFIENARADGWEIRVDSSYKIISVKPIRTPAESVFGGGH